MVDVRELKPIIFSKFEGFELRIPITDTSSGCGWGLQTDRIIDAKVRVLPYAIYIRTNSHVFDETMSPLFKFELSIIYCEDLEMQVNISDNLKKNLSEG